MNIYTEETSSIDMIGLGHMKHYVAINNRKWLDISWKYSIMDICRPTIDNFFYFAVGEKRKYLAIEVYNRRVRLWDSFL